MFIDDVVTATILGIEKEEANGQVFNVGSGIAVDVLKVAKTLINAYNIDVPITISGKFRLGDIRHNYADLTKINTILGFEPKVFFEEGVLNFTKWVLSQKIEKDILSVSLAEMKKKGLLK